MLISWKLSPVYYGNYYSTLSCELLLIFIGAVTFFFFFFFDTFLGFFTFI